MTYENWIKEVDEHLIVYVGLSHDDCEDWLWRDAHEDGVPPLDAVQEFLAEVVYPTM